MGSKFNIFQILKLFFANIFIFILSIFLPFLLFFVLLLLSPIYVFRLLVSKYCKLMRPDLGKILTTHSTLSGVDNMYASPKCSICAVLVAEGDISIEALRNRMIESVNTKNPRAEFLYPEFKQSIAKFMGFLFWKWDNHFNVNNHVKYFNPSGDTETFSDQETTEDDLQRILSKLIRKPYLQGKSPWELVLVKNYKPKYPDHPHVKHSVLILRFSHALCDGYSILKMLARHVTKDESLLQRMPTATSFKKQHAFQKCLKSVWTLIKLPFEVTKFILSPPDSNHGWRKTEAEITQHRFFGIGKGIDLGYFKDIKDSLKCSLTSVLFAGIAGVIRKMMLQQGLNPPKFIKVACPFPMPNHPNKLRNHMSLGVITLPILEEDPLTRLRIIDEHFEKVSLSSVPFAMFVGGQVVGGLFTCMVKVLAKVKLTTGLVSNMPGFQKPMNFLGSPIPDAFFGGDLLRGDVGIVLNTVSYGGRMRVTITADSSIIDSDENMQQLIQYIESEYDRLKRIGDV